MIVQPSTSTTLHLPFTYSIKTREHSRRVLVLFLGIALAFGLISWLFFVSNFLDALKIAGGLALMVLGSLPISHLEYTLTGEKIEVMDLTADRFSATTAIPLLAGICIFLILFFSMPAIYYFYVGFVCVTLLPFLRRFFPHRTKQITQSLTWSEVQRVVQQPARHVFLLATSTVGGSTKKDMLVFCPAPQFQKILHMCLDLAHLGHAEDGSVVR